MNWIPLDKQLPEKRDHLYDVLLFQVDTILAPPCVFIAQCDGETFWDWPRGDEIQIDVCTHWAYITFPDKEKDSLFKTQN